MLHLLKKYMPILLRAALVILTACSLVVICLFLMPIVYLQYLPIHLKNAPTFTHYLAGGSETTQAIASNRLLLLGKGAIPFVVGALQSEDVERRRNAVVCLRRHAEIDDERRDEVRDRADVVLKVLLWDESKNVGFHSAVLLSTLYPNEEKYIQHLGVLLESTDDWTLQTRIIHELASFGPKARTAAPCVRRSLEKVDRSLARDCLDLLQQLEAADSP